VSPAQTQPGETGEALVSGAGVAPAVIAVRPAPDPQVLAVLTAAVEMAWPRARAAAPPEPPGPPAWRFSGRWWSRPPTTRRMRPWS
jgi:hypothetical protein